jgi:D-alanine-D-alanine ligase
MIVGLCFDLRSWYLDQGYSWEETAEFDKEETIEGIETALHELGYNTTRIGNVFQLVESLAAHKRWDLIFNICEGIYGNSRESAVPALLDQYRIPYVFSNAEVLGISLNKQLAKQVVASSGIPVAPGYIIHHPGELTKYDFDFPLFVKPLAEGSSKGISGKSRVENYAELTEAVIDILNKNLHALVEEYLPGREFTVGVVGNGNSTKVVGTMEVFSADAIYSMEVKENYERLANYKIPEESMLKTCAEVALKAWNALGGADGGRIDLRFDKNNRLSFIEANPLPGLNPIHSDLPLLAGMNHISYTRLIGMIMEAALTRLNLKP